MKSNLLAMLPISILTVTGCSAGNNLESENPTETSRNLIITTKISQSSNSAQNHQYAFTLDNSNSSKKSIYPSSVECKQPSLCVIKFKIPQSKNQEYYSLNMNQGNLNNLTHTVAIPNLNKDDIYATLYYSSNASSSEYAYQTASFASLKKSGGKLAVDIINAWVPMLNFIPVVGPFVGIAANLGLSLVSSFAFNNDEEKKKQYKEYLAAVDQMDSTINDLNNHASELYDLTKNFESKVITDNLKDNRQEIQLKMAQVDRVYNNINQQLSGFDPDTIEDQLASNVQLRHNLENTVLAQGEMLKLDLALNQLIPLNTNESIDVTVKFRKSLERYITMQLSYTSMGEYLPVYYEYYDSSYLNVVLAINSAITRVDFIYALVHYLEDEFPEDNYHIYGMVLTAEQEQQALAQFYQADKFMQKSVVEADKSHPSIAHDIQIRNNFELFQGESLSITNDGVILKLKLQEDGNLVVSRNNLAYWASNTATNDEHSGASVAFQDDGNIVIFDAAHNVVWSSASSSERFKRTFKFQKDGNLVVYEGTTPKWAICNDNPNVDSACNWLN